MRRTMTTSFVLTLLITAVLAGPAFGRARHQSTPVMWHPQTMMTGGVGGGAGATLVRRPGGVSFSMRTLDLRAGHAYTIWFVVLNNPAACNATPCNAQDILLNPETDAQVTYAAGHVSGGNGQAGFAGSFRVGALDGWLPGGRLANPLTAEIQLVLNDHGPKLPAYMPGMIHT
nr:hypothetical protein [Chloroflexota bacterium]